ncbi:MAG: MoaD/ThiS family protein [Oleibacter sp.]|nr:MoaD/ThiS family protein [Thalassolituus sp.]
MKVMFFAQLREKLGSTDTEVDVVLPCSVAQLRLVLSEMFPQYKTDFIQGKALVAVNQTLSDEMQMIQQGDEVAVFPPVTGG